MMTEKEKAAQGLLYDANFNQELLNDRKRAKELIYRYNLLSPTQETERLKLLHQLLGKCQESLIIEPPFHCDYGYNIEIDACFYANVNLVILDGAKVTIGKQVFIGPNVAIYTAEHPLDSETRVQGLEYAHPITIGDRVWIGGNVVILPGVTIGNDCVIGAGSIVTKNIPPYTLAVGNPCRVVRNLTPQEIKK